MVAFINDLPVELLVEIMKHLDEQSAKQAVLTCKKWKDVIESFFSWSINLDMEFLSQLIVDLMKTNRKIRKMTLTDYSSETDRTKNDRRLENGSLFFKLFKCLPNLEDVRLSYIDTPEVVRGRHLPDLKKLKVLKLYQCNGKVLRRFRSSGVESLSIDIFMCDQPKIHHFVDFVRRQQNLTKLCLTSFPDKFFQQLCHTTPNGTIQSKLTELKFEVIVPTEYGNEWSGLLNFIKIHSNTLHKLKLDRINSKKFHDLIFGEIASLKFLELNRIGGYNQVGVDLKKSESIENLVLERIATLALSDLCKSMPNVKNFTLWDDWCDWNAEKLQIICSALHNVTKLCVAENRYAFDEIKFPNLTTLCIGFVGDEADWNAFTIANSKITEIIIFKVSKNYFNLKHIEIISRNLKLQTLKIFSGISADEHVVSTIRKNCPDLKVLDLQDLHYTIHLPEHYRHAARVMGLNIPFS